MRRITLFLALVAFLPAWSQTLPTEQHIEVKIDSVLRGMSLEDKIGQLNQLDGRGTLDVLRGLISKGQLGSVMNVTDPEMVNELQRIACEESPARIPLLFARDVVHGFRTMLPIPLGLAATFDEELVEAGARMAAIEASEHGIRWAFAPMMDISRDPRWGRIAESFGEDTFLTSRMGLAVVRGYQGQKLSDPASVAACAKHFVGYGAAEGGRDYNTTGITERELRGVYLPPFEAVFHAGCASVMTSFNSNDGLPTSANPFLLDSLLRKEWGFDGVVVSDWGAVSELISHGMAANKSEAAAKALTAGTDMDMSSKSYITHLGELVARGDVSEQLVDRAVRRMLRLKFRLGLFERPYTSIVATPRTASREHLALAQRAAEESVVLLKNENSLLPLHKELRRILVVGPMANAPHDQLGTWTMDGDTTMTRTPLEGMRELFGKHTEVLYTPGLKYSRDHDRRGFKHVVELARKADVVVAFLGEEAILTGEAHCLSNISLQGAQKELVELLHASGKPLVSVFLAGRPMTIGQEAELSNAVLYSWHPGTMGGDALARILAGEVNPSGKLPVTFPAHVGQIPMYYNHRSTGRPASGKEKCLDEIPLNARQSVLGHSSYYLDTGHDPLYRFGFGLSYTTFELSDLKIEKSQLPQDGFICLSVVLSNTGSRIGAEVVQLYVSDPLASVTRPVRELKAYRRVELAPGEARRVAFSVPVSELAFWDNRMRLTAEPGRYVIGVGNDSSPKLTTTVEVLP